MLLACRVTIAWRGKQKVAHPHRTPGFDDIGAEFAWEHGGLRIDQGMVQCGNAECIEDRGHDGRPK